MPGIHFLIGAVCMLVSVIITHRVLTREKRERPELRDVISGGGETQGGDADALRIFWIASKISDKKNSPTGFGRAYFFA